MQEAIWMGIAASAAETRVLATAGPSATILKANAPGPMCYPCTRIEPAQGP